MHNIRVMRPLCFHGRPVQCLFLLLASIGTHAEVCDPNALRGAYGFSFASNTTIGGTTRPVVGIGRLLFDTGKVSGVTSSSFTGLILGNPVTGTYEAKLDCSVEWRLQDTSGAFQHFSGTMSADGGRVTFRQTDPGGAENGILLRTTNECCAGGLNGAFRLTITGRSVDVATALESGPVSFSGLLVVDGAGRLTSAAGPDGPPLVSGMYRVNGDCFVEGVLEVAPGGKKAGAMHFRGIVVEQGRVILGIQTDPGTAVTLRLLSM